MVKSKYLGHTIFMDGDTWVFPDLTEVPYTPDLAGSGQFSRCSKCNKLPTKEGHDGCLGTLPEDIVMNACCGHGDDSIAYIQYWDGSCIRGKEAKEEQESMIKQDIGEK